jgi:hypothetical protein
MASSDTDSNSASSRPGTDTNGRLSHLRLSRLLSHEIDIRPPPGFHGPLSEEEARARMARILKGLEVMLPTGS